MGTAAVLWLGGEGARAATVVVRPGDTLSAIAARHGTSVAALTAANGIEDPNFIVAGRRLEIPRRPAAVRRYVVRAGDTLSAIASRSGTTAAALARLNKLDDPDLVRIGQRLRIPAAQAAVVGPVEDVEHLLVAHAVSHGLEPALVKAVAWQESGWRQSARSDKGAVGVMQVIPPTARFVNRVLGGGKLRLRATGDNIHLGVMYLRHLLDTVGGERRALAAYYSGPGNVGSKLAEYQRRYVRSVMALKRRYQ